MLALRSGCCLAFVLSFLAGCGGSHGEGTGGAGPSSSSGGAFGQGAGGAGGGASGGEGPAPIDACSADADCALLETPQCWKAVCNTGQFPGPSGKCVYLPDDEGQPCDDGLFCTIGDTCLEGACSGGANDCGMAGGNCETVVCLEDAQACATESAPNGTACMLDDLCVAAPKCDEGVCGGVPKACPDVPFGSCTQNACNPATGECEESPDPGKDGDPCVDDPCLVSQTCSSGNCIGGEPMDCSQWTQGCMQGVCDPTFGFCTQEPIPAGGTCAPEASECNAGTCDVAGNCAPVPFDDGTPCSDGNSCTQGETCTGGQCLGGVVTTPLEIYFSDDFSSNAAGWQLDTEWEIGPAVPPTSAFAPDPEVDHSPSDDNGMAGTVIGGDASFMAHPYWFMTSPVIDVSAVPGPLYLEYQRWLNTDFPPWMEQSIDVWDGTQWVDVWTSDGFEQLADIAWTRVAFDLTPYKNAALQVRFGQAVHLDGFVGWSGWNIDDVRLVNQSCD